MADDKPLSSEDMIRRAREELNLPLPADHLEIEMRVEDPGDDLALIDDEEPIEFQTRSPRRRPARPQPVPTDPFAARSAVPPNRAAIVAGIVLLLLGVGVALLVFASTATQP
jgi:hypothetical protein